MLSRTAEKYRNIGYDVEPPWRRQGHATRMLAAGLIECRRLGLRRILQAAARRPSPAAEIC